MTAFLSRTLPEIAAILFMVVVAVIILIYVVKKFGLKTKWVSTSSSKIPTSHVRCHNFNDIGTIIRLAKSTTRNISRKWYKDKTRNQLESIENTLFSTKNKFKEFSRDYCIEVNRIESLSCFNLAIDTIINDIKNIIKGTILKNNFPEGDAWTKYKEEHYSIISSGVKNRLIDFSFVSDKKEIEKLDNIVIIPILKVLKADIHSCFNSSKKISDNIKKEIKQLEKDFSNNYYSIILKKDGGDNEKDCAVNNSSFDK